MCICKQTSSVPESVGTSVLSKAKSKTPGGDKPQDGVTVKKKQVFTGVNKLGGGASTSSNTTQQQVGILSIEYPTL